MTEEEFNLSENEKAIIINLISDRLANEFRDIEVPLRYEYVQALRLIREKLKEKTK